MHEAEAYCERIGEKFPIYYSPEGIIHFDCPRGIYNKKTEEVFCEEAQAEHCPELLEFKVLFGIMSVRGMIDKEIPVRI